MVCMHLLGDLSKMRQKTSGAIAEAWSLFSRTEKTYILVAVTVFFIGLSAVLMLEKVALTPQEEMAASQALNESAVFTYELPPIVVPLAAGPQKPRRPLIINGALQFEGETEGRLRESVRVAKRLTPSIMDAIQTRMRRSPAKSSQDTAAINQAVLDSTNGVLNRYGVTASRVLVEDPHAQQ